jgi:uncharacterized protein (DUF697 family)
METRTRRVTNRYSAATAVVAFITQPVPALDELIVVPFHYVMASRLARLRRASILKLPWRSIQRIIWYGAGARLLANASVGLVPVVGAFANSVTAIALTEFLARWLDELFEHPDRPPPEVTARGLKELFVAALRRQGKSAGSQAKEPAPAAEAVGAS